MLALVAALLVAGCGGDDEGDEGSAEPVSEEEYATEIGDILTGFGEESINLASSLAEAQSTDELLSGVEELSDLTETSVDELTAIEPPEEASEGHETLTTALEGYLDDLNNLSTALEDAGDDPQAVQDAALEFQEAATSVQTDLQEAATQLQEAGIEPPTP